MQLDTVTRIAKLYFACGIIFCISIVPLSYFLPASRLALVVTFLIFGLFQALAIGSIARRNLMALLQGLNLLAMVGTALQALNPSQKFAFSTSSAAVLLAALFVAVYRSLPLGSVRCAYPGLSLALGLTLVSWLLVQLVLVETPFEVWPAHFRMAMRALFLGPLGLFAVIFIKCIVGRNRTLTVMAALCVGQYAIGLIELGVRLDSKFLIYAALTSIPAFFVLTFLSISRTRHAQGDVNH